jgi:hypothetical protein
MASTAWTKGGVGGLITGLQRIGVMALLKKVHGVAIQRQMVPAVQDVLL